MDEVLEGSAVIETIGVAEVRSAGVLITPGSIFF